MNRAGTVVNAAVPIFKEDIQSMNLIKRLGGVVALAALSVTAMASGAKAANIQAYVKGQIGDKLVVVLVRDTTITYQQGGKTVNYPIHMATVSIADLQGHV